MREFQVGDTVYVNPEYVADLKYVPNLPETITNTTGTVTCDYRAKHYNEKYYTVVLLEAPDCRLEFPAADLTLLVPAEVNKRLESLEDALAELTASRYPTA